MSCQNRKLSSSKFCFRLVPSFTLIELLIVIAIIAILAGVVISVINPVQQRKKAQEGVLRANVTKICAAWAACKGSQTTTANEEGYCDQVGDIGITTPTTPTGATYTYPSSTKRWTGTLGTCTFYCDKVTNKVTLSGTCTVPE